jgi:hypothetical protein
VVTATRPPEAELPRRARVPAPLLGATALVALAITAAAAPLLTYSLSLAVFGLAHVAVELRYVEARFGRRLSLPLIRGLCLLLAAVVALRLLRYADVADAATRTQLELVVVALIAGSVTRDIGLRAGLASATAVAAAAAIGLGAALAPVPTLLALAVLHNWTPVAFVAEAGEPARRRWTGWGLVAFVGVPALLVAGPVHALTDGWGLRDASPVAAGGLHAHLGAFLPRSWHADPFATRLFSAIAFAQCMHYAAVLGVMPRLASGMRDGTPVGPLTAIPWGAFVGSLALGSLVLFAWMAADFQAARSAYAVIASVHAWVELPVLIVALAPRTRPVEAR